MSTTELGEQRPKGKATQPHRKARVSEELGERQHGVCVCTRTHNMSWGMLELHLVLINF